MGTGSGKIYVQAVGISRLLGRRSILAYRSASGAATLTPYKEAIRELADTEKEAVGFLPAAAYDEAINRSRVVAMLDTSFALPELVGFVLFSGVFPHARIQQIVVAQSHRRKGVASALVREVISRHEAGGYLRVTAAVADNLPAAQAFYESNGFGAAVERHGGSARRRTIIVRARDLDNDHLLSVIEPSRRPHPEAVDLGLRIRGASLAPLYAIDLNVLFNAVRMGRVRAAVAQRIVGAALAHRFRLVTTAEFVVELDRNPIADGNDPTLALARQLPRLPDVDRAQADALAATIYGIVFGSEQTAEARRIQAKSDARHLAQVALARASGFVTSDGRMLDARARLMDEVGIDVLSLDEFSAMLDDLPRGQGQIAPLPATDFVREQLKKHIADEDPQSAPRRRQGLGRIRRPPRNLGSRSRD